MHTFWCFRTTNPRASGSCLQGRCSWSTSTEPVGVSMCLLCCAWQHPGIDHSQNPYRRRAKQYTVLLPARDPTEAHLCFCLWLIHTHPVFLSIQGSESHEILQEALCDYKRILPCLPLSNVKPGLGNTAREGLDVNSGSWWPGRRGLVLLLRPYCFCKGLWNVLSCSTLAAISVFSLVVT